MARGDVDGALKLVVPFHVYAGIGQTWFALQTATARLDALVAASDRRSVEREATPLTTRQTYLEPFALRALGRVRDDEHLIQRAVERFEAMHLDWFAEQTRALG